MIAVTLVHKGAMEIAVHAVESFARSFANMDFQLEIHTDGSPDETDEKELLARARGLDARIVRLSDREERLAERLADFPRTAGLISRRGYFTKLELPMYLDPPYFYFDSDIVWLRGAEGLVPPDMQNAFSTETWSWYYGVRKDSRWIAARTPRRVNSGFYFVGESFPFEKMEGMLANGLYDPEIPYSTDQEIMAYLYPNMVNYHIDDLKRSRVGAIYDLSSLECAALHFPGGMWRAHMDQIGHLMSAQPKPPVSIRYSSTVRLDRFELFRMRSFLSLSKSRLLKPPLDIYRNIRKAMSRR
jgi:hypothetical protein